MHNFLKILAKRGCALFLAILLLIETFSFIPIINSSAELRDGETVDFVFSKGEYGDLR